MLAAANGADDHVLAMVPGALHVFRTLACMAPLFAGGRVTPMDRFAPSGAAGFRVCDAMAKKGVLTRPVGNVIVLLPPYCTTQSQARRMARAVYEACEEIFRK